MEYGSAAAALLLTLNLPNQVTLARLVLTGIFVAVVTLEIPWMWSWASILFIIGSVTDFVDGWLARKYGLVTNFGVLMAPIGRQSADLLGLCHPGGRGCAAGVARLGRDGARILDYRPADPGRHARFGAVGRRLGELEDRGADCGAGVRAAVAGGG